MDKISIRGYDYSFIIIDDLLGEKIMKRMRKILLGGGIATTMAFALAAQTVTPYSIRRRAKPTKPCLSCGILHQHNNAFCSANCCKAHKELTHV